MKASTFLKSTVILTVATLTSKILGSLFRIPLQNMAGDEVLGIFSLVYPVYMVALILSVAGIPIAISKLIAEARTSGSSEDIYYIQKTARILALILGAITLGGLITFSGPLAHAIGGLSTEPALIAVSFTLLAAPYMAVDRGYFQGFEDMKPTAISQVIEQFIRVLIILTAAYVMTALQFSDAMIAAGVMLSSLFGVMGSMIYLKKRLSHSSFKVTQTYTYQLRHFKIWGKKILSVSVPIAIGTVTMALFNVVDSLTIPHFLTNAAEGQTTYLYGIYGRGLALVQIATVFATSVVLPLIPSLTTHVESGHSQEAKKLIETTRWLTHLLSWPIAALLIGLAVPLNIALFTNTEGSLMIAITGFSSIFISLTLVGTAILQGMNAPRLAAGIILIGALMKAGSNALLVPHYGIEGAAAASGLTYFVIMVLNSFVIMKFVPIQVLPLHLSKIIWTTLLLGGPLGAVFVMTQPFEWSRTVSFLVCVITALLFVFLYAFVLIKWRAYDYEAVKNVPILSRFI
ncbi:Membrane protein involved in the export of O-antigen and teichoic acid [Halobacillus karajensis]|uniref:putative polysaccharide biosynthesis protein n=1 Tax=Halobacillus karajensis TaxID=195088 RepID=UPI0008A76B38|nr:polysaccharide biosynthesis protein [Halobacillus karajensis]SEH44370.1 Membrane protein involved in the export of O-antigen and teichoic acid [Halobacillus karajensis]